MRFGLFRKPYGTLQTDQTKTIIYWSYGVWLQSNYKKYVYHFVFAIFLAVNTTNVGNI